MGQEVMERFDEIQQRGSDLMLSSYALLFSSFHHFVIPSFLHSIIPSFINHSILPSFHHSFHHLMNSSPEAATDGHLLFSFGFKSSLVSSVSPPFPIFCLLRFFHEFMIIKKENH